MVWFQQSNFDQVLNMHADNGEQIYLNTEIGHVEKFTFDSESASDTKAKSEDMTSTFPVLIPDKERKLT